MKAIQKVVFLVSVLLLATNSYAGRWLTRDPIEFMERDPHPTAWALEAIHLEYPSYYQIKGNLYPYAFVENDPVNEIDPYGLDNIYGGSNGGTWNNNVPNITLSGPLGGGPVNTRYNGGGLGDPIFLLTLESGPPAWLFGAAPRTTLALLDLIKGSQNPDPCKNKNFDPNSRVDQRDNDWHYHWDNNPHDSRGGQPHWDRGNLHDSSQQWSPDGDNWHDK